MYTFQQDNKPSVNTTSLNMAAFMCINEKRSFQRRKESLFRKAFELQQKSNAKVAVVIELMGETYLYNCDESWPPSINDLV